MAAASAGGTPALELREVFKAFGAGHRAALGKPDALPTLDPCPRRRERGRASPRLSRSSLGYTSATREPS